MIQVQTEQDQYRSGGYIYLAANGCPTLRVPVESADMASVVFQRYRDQNGIGVSDLKRNCGNIYTSLNFHAKASDNVLLPRIPVHHSSDNRSRY